MHRIEVFFSIAYDQITSNIPVALAVFYYWV